MKYVNQTMKFRGAHLCVKTIQKLGKRLTSEGGTCLRYEKCTVIGFFRGVANTDGYRFFSV